MACLCGALARVFRPSTYKWSTITIDESVEGELFHLVHDYLTHKYGLLNATGVTETFKGMELKWSPRSEEKNGKKFWFIRSRRKNRFLELSFRSKHRSRVKSEYFDYVRKEARRIRDEKKHRQRERIQTCGSVATVLSSIGSVAISLTNGN